MFRSSAWPLLLCSTLAAVLTGCGSDRLPVVFVEGKVLYNGKPLHSGGVMFQPVKGPVSRGSIQPDGTFVLSTYQEGDGATIGMHKVRIVCYDIKEADALAYPAHEGPKPKSLIPKKYTRAETSNIQIEVKEKNQPFVIELTD